MAPTVFSAAVLTGGASRRMGRDKAFVAVDGVPMVVRVASTLHEAGATPVVAVGGDLGRLQGAGLVALADPRQGEGPLGGLVTALEAADGAVLVVVATDLAWLDAATVRALVAGVSDDPDADVAVAVSDRRQPLCAAWRVARCVEPARTAFDSGERAVHRVVQRLAAVDVPVPVAVMRNANRPEDLHQ
jgi:molybdopterin-guanine dinucleotide biosynthesis protein A